MMHFFGNLTEKQYLRSANYRIMQHKSNLTTCIGWLMILLGVIGCFVFFQCFYPYHLQHREQTMLFLCNVDYILEHYPFTSGWFSRLLGDFLQQFFYYLVAGPVIVAILLTLIAFVTYRIVRNILPQSWGRYVAYTLALIVMLWEGGRECLPEYPLGSSIQVLGILLFFWGIFFCKSRLHKASYICSCSVFTLWMFGYEPLPNTKLYGMPDMMLEHQLALDVEASYGHWQKVEEMTQENLPYNIDIYYHNLALAIQNRLGGDLFSRHQNFQDGLFLPVNEKGNFFLFTAANEAWWAIGDLTMAEHAAMLGMIFSPRKACSRNIRRLAEINLAKGDKAAAMKYLRMLQQTLVHRKWAESYIDNDAMAFIQSNFQSMTDTLRLTSQTQRSLRNLLDSHPDNMRALQYLLSYDMLTKDLDSFAADFDRYNFSIEGRAYEEAMLIIMNSRPEKRLEWREYVHESTFVDFLAFNEKFAETNGNAMTLKPRFGYSFWYYMKFAKPLE